MASGAPGNYPHFCSICGETLDHSLSTTYANPVCDGCDSRAVSEPGVPARQGDNPVFIDGIRCFRRYKMGGWLSQRDTLSCDDYDEFYDTHYDDFGPIHTFNQPDPPKEGREIRQFSEVRDSSEDGITARVVENDILEEDADALICGITTDPSLDGGVAGAVCDASEHPLRLFVREKAPLNLGSVVVTGGFDLPYSYLVFVVAAEAEADGEASIESVSDAVRSGLRQTARLRLPTVALPLVGSGLGGLTAEQSARAIERGIQASGASPPLCVRVVARNASDRDAAKSHLSADSAGVPDLADSDPLEGTVCTVLEKVDQSGDADDWEVELWAQFGPWTGEPVEDPESIRPDNESLSNYASRDEARELVENRLEKFSPERGHPEQWLAEFERFNSMGGGYRAAIAHPALQRRLYAREQALVGMLRGLEHADAFYRDIHELVLEPPERGYNGDKVGRLRYGMPPDEDGETAWWATVHRVVEYTVETLDDLDFEHEMSDMLRVDPVDRIEIVAYTGSRVSHELELPYDIAEDLVCGGAGKQALATVANSGPTPSPTK